MPGAPRQRWYCSVSFRWKASRGGGAADPGRARRGAPSGRADLRLHALDQRDEALVREIPGRSDDDVAGRVARAVIRGDRAPGDVGYHLRAPQHGASQRVVPENRLREEVVDQLLRRVLDHRDLLEDDLALGVEVDELRREDQVGHHVERFLDMLVQHACVDDGVVACGRRIELAAEAVEDLRDLLRRVLLRPLEEQMLQEVRNARPRVVLVPGAGADPEAEGHGANGVERLADDPRAARKRRQQVVLHARIVDLCLRRPG